MPQALPVFVPPEAYPALIPPAARVQAMMMLKSSVTLARAAQAVALKAPEMREAVLALIEELDEALRTSDWPAAFAATHEIRGLAGSAGLAATGRIANGLCRYLDAAGASGTEPEDEVANLHLDALIRSTRPADDTLRHGDAVAEQLAALVDRRLAGLKD
jgi:HPt (histidine-containing phosphotransfer) domain-containing protein